MVQIKEDEAKWPASHRLVGLIFPSCLYCSRNDGGDQGRVHNMARFEKVSNRDK